MQKSYLQAEQEMINADEGLVKMGKQYDELLEWSVAYQNAPMVAKKIIVSNLIERVDVFRGYKLNIKLRITIEQFLNGLVEIEDAG